MNTAQIDDRIRQALSDEDRKLFEEFNQEPSLLQQALETLQGRNRWMTAMVMVVGTVFMVLGVWSLFQFASAEELKPMISWAMAFAFCMATVSMLKIWAWMEIQKKDTVREIKRLELQLARLSQKSVNK